MITPEQVADSLTGDDNDYNDELDGWFGLSADGAILYISFTDSESHSKVHFRAVVERVSDEDGERLREDAKEA